MNEFNVQPDRELTPQQMVMGIMGISAAKLISMIQENRGGQFDCLYIQKPAAATAQEGARE